MKPRIATLVPVLAAAGIAVAGCSGGDQASGPTSPTPPVGSQSNSSRPGVSIAPSNAPPGAGSGSAGAPGATGDDKGGANSGGNGGSSTGALPAPNGNTGPGSLPVGFPLPSGTTLGRIAVRTTDITAPMEVEALVTSLGIGDRLRHRPSELSGGQQQRVAMGRALITRPALVFADEPTGNLDSRVGQRSARTRCDPPSTSSGQTVVMVTHDVHGASYADRVLFLADGRMVEELHYAEHGHDPRDCQEAR